MEYYVFLIKRDVSLLFCVCREAGVAKHTGDKELARMGVITFRIGIHGIPLDLKPEAYANLQAGALKNYMYHHMDNREEYYYNRVFLGCIRANDFIASLPQYDGENLRLMVEAREEH